MPEIVLRLALLLLIGLLIWLLVWLGRRFVAQSRRYALAAAPLPDLKLANPGTTASSLGVQASPRVHILAFSSEDCRQCHQLQDPALKRVLAARGGVVTLTEVDATTETELTQHYHVLTVPTTVLLDEQGNAHAVNYGFTNAQSLLEQIDKILQPRNA